MPFEATKDALTEIVRTIELARGFVSGATLESFSADTRTVFAITRCLEIISEASRKLPTELKKRYPDIPWNDIAGAGNVYRHDYDKVIDRFLWDTVQNELEPLRIAANLELERLKEQS
jgi:uncharacterized protein with HEPN domain